MAGPDILASKMKALPSTCSPTKNPMMASMATRPCARDAAGDDGDLGQKGGGLEAPVVTLMGDCRNFC
jgi:hypothetical protein